MMDHSTTPQRQSQESDGIKELGSLSRQVGFPPFMHGVAPSHTHLNSGTYNHFDQSSLQHAMFYEMQARAAAASAANGPLLLERSHGGVQEMSEEIGKIAAEGIEETVSNEVFSLYKNKEIIPGCKPHPGEIVEAGSLSALSLPDRVYPLAQSLPSEIVTDGKLSALQLEGVLHACQRHQIILPNGSRAGFFLGDAAGVGKGRQIAGVILDNYIRGRTKHIWFSISADLIVDARRDFSDLGCHIKVIEGAQQLDKETRVLGLPADFKEGVVFSTYATLVSSVNKQGGLGSRQSRLQQLIDWCGGEKFEGCLIFDECHKAKNFVPGKEQASTKVAMAVTKIQRMLPRARVMYCSATGVSDVKNMAFMERLGLWGDGAAFKSFDQFLDTIRRKGLGVAEMLAMEMKTSGMYVARSLSYSQAEFVTEQISLTDDQIKMYNRAAHVWNELRKSLEAALRRTGSSNNRVWSSFWAAHQRFFRQLCLGIKVPHIVSEAKKALEQGYCVVIGLQTTGEASLESEMNRSKEVIGFKSLCREILTTFIEKHFPTKIQSQDNGSSPAEDDWSVTAKQMLLGFAQQIELPDSTLDEIIDRLGGPGNVAEMTGRRGRVVRWSQGEPPRYELRDTDSGNIDSLNVRERNMFMEGKKLVAIISDAASTGISLHASLKVANQRRRVHMTIELPWSADKAVQQLGRSHRSNQAIGPLYKLLTTDLGGEKRFAAAVAKRLQSLGAISKGDRRAATGIDLDEFNFDTPYGRNALRIMYNSISQKVLAPGVLLESVTEGKSDFTTFNTMMTQCLMLMGIFEQDTLTSMAKVKDSLSTDISKFLNRIFGLKVNKQQLLFNYFTKCLDSQISAAKRDNRYNEGLLDIIASSVRLAAKPREVFKSHNKTNNPTMLMILEVDRGMSWEEALRRYKNNPGEDNGFYCSRRENHGKRLFLLATLKQGSKHIYKIARPNTGVSKFEEDKTDLLKKYTPISVEKAKEGWTNQHEVSKKHCIHGSTCRAGRDVCTVGRRCYKIHLLCGSIVTLMSLLESTIAVYGPRLNLSKSESTLRVVRAKLSSGDRVVGIRYPEILISLVEKQLQQDDILNGMTTPQQTGHVSGGCVVEPVSEVIARLKKKVTTPPVTLKTFFKATSDGATSKTSSSAVASDVTPRESTAAEVTGSQLSVAPSVNDDVTSDETGDVIGDVSCDDTGVMTSDLTSDGLGVLKHDKTPAVTGQVTRDVTSKLATASPRCTQSRKRTAAAAAGSCVQPSAKKSRRTIQTSIMTFAKPKQEQRPTEQRSSEIQSSRTMACPVCGRIFPATTLNTDINKHIDQCLIE